MKIKHIILLIMSLIYFNDMMADTKQSPIEIVNGSYDYSVEYQQYMERYLATGTFSLEFSLDNIDVSQCIIEISDDYFGHTYRNIPTRNPSNDTFHFQLDNIPDYFSLVVFYLIPETNQQIRLDDYPIYVRDYLSPEDYKLIYGGAGVDGIRDDEEDISLTQASDAVTIKSGNSDLQEVRVCDMTGKSILAVPASGNSSEISIDRTRLAKGLNILSVFRQDSPTKSFKILN